LTVKINWGWGVRETDQPLAKRMQAIIDAGRQVKVAVDELDKLASERLGVHCGDLRCLRLLEKGPATPGDVGCATGLTSGSVTALLDRLEGAGFIERRRSESDRRSVELALPDDRRTRLLSVGDQIEASIAAHFAGRNAGELESVAAILTDFAAALQRAGAGLVAGEQGETGAPR
jgi:DNA-binding MarR family transcriptional regulator